MHLTSGISWCIHILIFPILTRTKATKNKKNNNNLYIDTRNESFPFLLSPVASILHTTHTLTHSHAQTHKYIRFVLAVAVEMLRIVGHYSEHMHTLSMDTISARGFRCDKEICSVWCIDLSSLFSLLLLFLFSLFQFLWENISSTTRTCTTLYNLTCHFCLCFVLHTYLLLSFVACERACVCVCVNLFQFIMLSSEEYIIIRKKKKKCIMRSPINDDDNDILYRSHRTCARHFFPTNGRN